MSEDFPPLCAHGISERVWEVDCLINMKIRDYFHEKFWMWVEINFILIENYVGGSDSRTLNWPMLLAEITTTRNVTFMDR